ncbi:MAG: AEC family transporter, partial [Dechloromonas sp.]|nr:AEC family transporter [Dechloromonas sp.]
MNTALLLLPDFALILLGTAIRRWMHLGDHFWNGVEKLVYFILFPALLINAIIKTRLDIGSAMPLLATALAAMAAGMVLGLIPKLFSRLPAL